MVSDANIMITISGAWVFFSEQFNTDLKCVLLKIFCCFEVSKSMVSDAKVKITISDAWVFFSQQLKTDLKCVLLRI